MFESMDHSQRYAGVDRTDTKRNSYNKSQRFSRHRQRERFRQDRHTIERERNPNPIDRSSKIRRSTRPHSTARCETSYHPPQSQHHHHSRPEEIVWDYTMTLPATRGRHRSRRNGISRDCTSKFPLANNMLTICMISFPNLLEKRAQSVDPRIFNRKYDAPILCNKYAIDDLIRRESVTEELANRSRSMPRSQNRGKGLYTPSRETSPVPKRLHQSERHRYLAPPLPPEDQYDEEEFIELQAPVKKVKRREKMPPSPRIMSPMGFAIHRQARLQQFDEETGMYDDNIDFHASDAPVRPVPIWLCVFLVIGYIIGGAFYFTSSESWSFLDSAYFCFITLTTIGS